MGANNEGVESCSELHQQVSLVDLRVAMTRSDEPQNNRAVFDSSTSVLVCLSDKLEVDSATNAAIVHGVRIDPRVDDQACAGLKAV